MNKDVKQKWLTALRTGEIDGQKIVQTKGVLSQPVNENGERPMCCLGVLTEIARREGVEVRTTETETRYIVATREDGSVNVWEEKILGDYIPLTAEVLPQKVKLWAGLHSDNPEVPLAGVAQYFHEDQDTYSSARYVPLGGLNDSSNAGFEGIADVIEKYL